MRIDGEWFECDDGVLRPVIRGVVQNATGDWEPMLFLVDTGADRTVFSAAAFNTLGFDPSDESTRIGGIGGIVHSVNVPTSIRLVRDDGGVVAFRSTYAAFTQLESLDISVLGRDVMALFSVIVDRPNRKVVLVRDQHRYEIHSSA